MNKASNVESKDGWYRVNYGNGTVTHPGPHLDWAKSLWTREYRYSSSAFIQQKRDGKWVKVL